MSPAEAAFLIQFLQNGKTHDEWLQADRAQHSWAGKADLEPPKYNVNEK